MKYLCAFLIATFSCVVGASEFRLATFSTDVTIPLNHRCMGVLPTKSKRVSDPLLAHGFVLSDGKQKVVLCALDWCEIRNGAFDQWREALAKAAGTVRENVLVTALHQHDAPVVDRDAAKILATVGLTDELYHVAWHDKTLARVSQAVRDSLDLATPVTHFGISETPVLRIASNRRVVLENGTVTYSRGSRSGGNKYFATAAEGDIDSMLKTITFFNNDKPLLQMHHYATHPMSYYGQGVVSADFVGLARARLQRQDQSIRQIFVPGCAGDITAGKFNNGSEDHRQELIDRLYQAMAKAADNTKRYQLQQLNIRNTKLQLPFHPGDHLTAKRLEADVANEKLSVEKRILAAMGLASRRRVASGQAIDFPCIDLGAAQILLFPGESFIGYQLMAQAAAKNQFVMCLAYGESWPGYIPTAAIFAENFKDSWLWVGPGSEKAIRQAIDDVLRK